MQDQNYWGTIWNDLYESYSRNKTVGDCASLWFTKEKAREYLEMSWKNYQRIEDILEMIQVTPESRILDIGAGPGTLSIPFARRVKKVVAIEPSPGMVSVMKEKATELSVNNLSVIEKRWEEINPDFDLDGSFDVVIASYSLGMPDIDKAIDKMISICNGTIWLFWFAGLDPWEEHMIHVWPEIFGTNYKHGPKCDVLFNILYEKGIYPNMSVQDIQYSRTYESLSLFIIEMRKQVGCTETYDETLKSYFLKTGLKYSGRIVQKGTSTRVCMWWDTKKFPKKKQQCFYPEE